MFPKSPGFLYYKVGPGSSINGIINHISRVISPRSPIYFRPFIGQFSPFIAGSGAHLLHVGACEPPLFWCFLPPKQGRISNQNKGQLACSFFLALTMLKEIYKKRTCFDKKSSMTHVFFVVSFCLNGKCTFHQFHPRFVGHPPQFLLRNRKG